MASSPLLSSSELHHPQVMSIEEVERILDETQEAVEYQRVCVAGRRLAHCQDGIFVANHCFPGEPRGPVGNSPDCPLMFPGHPKPSQTCPSTPLLLPQQIDELLAGSFTQEDEDAILEELNAITQVQSPGLPGPLGDGTLWTSAWWCVPLLCLSPESWFPDSFLW